MTTHMPYIESKPEKNLSQEISGQVAAGDFESGILTECDCWWQDTLHIFKKTILDWLSVLKLTATNSDHREHLIMLDALSASLLMLIICRQRSPVIDG